MANLIEGMFARQLEERKERLEEAAARAADPGQLIDLIRDVDRALEKLSGGTFGLCETCHEAIEPERLALDPLTRYCVDHLSEHEQRALERDLELAHQIQTRLLPGKDLALPGWKCAYHYEPSGQVSGDYCDIIPSPDDRGSFYFIVGDVTGKGIAASMLMSQLHAMFRTLVGTGLQLSRLMERINHLFCEASLTTHFATLVCGLARGDGKLEIANAGHCLPLLMRDGKVGALSTSGLPLGVSCDGKYDTQNIRLAGGEALLLYSDGLTESTGNSGTMYGEERILRLFEGLAHASPQELVAACIGDLNDFTGGARRSDDLTLMALRKE